jgi:hypothetical protein
VPQEAKMKSDQLTRESRLNLKGRIILKWFPGVFPAFQVGWLVFARPNLAYEGMLITAGILAVTLTAWVISWSTAVMIEKGAL